MSHTPLSPEHVATKQFVITTRGYDKQEVSTFLAAVADDYRTVQAEAAKPDACATLGSEVVDIVTAAHRAAEELRAKAEADVIDIRTQAERDADELRRMAEAELADLRDEVEAELLKVLTDADRERDEARAVKAAAEEEARARRSAAELEAEGIVAAAEARLRRLTELEESARNRMLALALEVFDAAAESDSASADANMVIDLRDAAPASASSDVLTVDSLPVL